MKKITLTIPNKLYGDKTVTAYEKDGLAVAKVHKVWNIYHASTGSMVYGKLESQSRAKAEKKIDKLLALGIDWTGDPSSTVDCGRTLSECVTEIRRIANGE